MMICTTNINKNPNELVPNNIYVLKLSHHSVGMDTLFERINSEFWAQKKALTANEMIVSKLGTDTFMADFYIPEFLKLPKYEVHNLIENNDLITLDEYNKLMESFSKRDFLNSEFYCPYLDGRVLLFRYDEEEKADETARKLTIKRLRSYQEKLKQKLSLMDKAEHKLERVIDDYDVNFKQKEKVVNQTLAERYENIDLAVSKLKDIEVI
jgi:hypothetical protein